MDHQANSNNVNQTQKNWKNVCVFAGSQPGTDQQFSDSAKKLGELLCKNDWGLVYGGGSVGLMGVIADAVLTGKGNVIGVIPEFLAVKELLHTGITETIVTQDMHTRKAKMAELSNLFIAMPGGLGTFEELFEVLTWAQLGVHQKPIGLLNVAGFYDPLINLIDHSIELGFIRPEHRQLVVSADDPQDLIDGLQELKIPEFKKWANIETT